MMGRSLALSSRYSHAFTRRQSDVGLPLRKLSSFIGGLATESGLTPTLAAYEGRT